MMCHADWPHAGQLLVRLVQLCFSGAEPCSWASKGSWHHLCEACLTERQMQHVSGPKGPCRPS